MSESENLQISRQTWDAWDAHDLDGAPAAILASRDQAVLAQVARVERG